MKKRIYLLTLILMAGLCTGCGKEGTESNEGTEIIEGTEINEGTENIEGTESNDLRMEGDSSQAE